MHGGTDLRGTRALVAIRVATIPLEDPLVAVEHEHVAAVHRVSMHVHLCQQNIVHQPLDPQQRRRAREVFHVAEPALGAAREVREPLREVRQEQQRLTVLHLAVLHRRPMQVVVELNSLVRGGAVLVGRRLVADPKMDRV